MKSLTPRYPLEAFRRWLSENGAADSTQMVYTARVRSTLGAFLCPSDKLKDVVACASESTLQSYLNGLSLSTRVQTATAWRVFATWGAVEGFAVPTLPDTRSRASLVQRAPPKEPTEVGGLPLGVAYAVWTLVKGRSRGNAPPPSVLMALRWKHVTFVGSSGPQGALRVSILFQHTTYEYRTPLTGFVTLWDWARGVSDVPKPSQPLIPAVSAGSKPIGSIALHSVLAAGKQERLPALQDPPPVALAAPPAPPAPPVPPSLPRPTLEEEMEF